MGQLSVFHRLDQQQQTECRPDGTGPLEVEDGWFQILLPSLQLILSDTIPEEHRTKAEYTLDRLHLRDDERVIRQRREWYRMYQGRELTLGGLRKKAPLIARAIEREKAEPMG